jgi:hypothetical protein
VRGWRRGDDIPFRSICILIPATVTRNRPRYCASELNRCETIGDQARVVSYARRVSIPESPGRYQIALAVSDRDIRTRRLDLFFYTREVEIDVV